MSKFQQVTILNTKGESVRQLPLTAAVLQQTVKPAVVHQVVVGYAANRRAGTAHTKTRDEVAGGGKKPWKQKGTGRARHGSIRSPLWVGGGVVFGPRSTRNFKHRLTDELKRQAKAMVVSDYLTAGRVLVVDELPQADKTKVYASLLKELKLKQGVDVLVLLTQAERAARRGMNNLRGVTVMGLRELNAYDGLRFRRWLVSGQGLTELMATVR